jgi:hypothetical protein
VTGVVAVATPEEMPVNEVAHLRDELGHRLDLVVANALRPDRFTDDEAALLEPLAAGGAPAAVAALAAHHRAGEQREQLDRLHADVTLPFVSGEDGAVDLHALADLLEEQL